MQPLNRRQFLLTAGTMIPIALAWDGSLLARALDSSTSESSAPKEPWYRRVRRVGQVNFNERDPVELNVTQWADYWQGVGADAVLVSVTGILAFYPTEVPFHRRSKYLGDRDLFGECTAEAKKRGIRVIARLSPDLEWEDAMQAHPEWFVRTADGGFVRHNEEPRLLRTCMFSSYFTEHIPAIMREVQSRYEVDALYTNGWPTQGGLPVCYCDACRKLAPPNTPAYWEQFTARLVEVWKFYDQITKEKHPDNLFFANLGLGLRAMPNLARVGAVAEWFTADNQGRSADTAPIWGAAQQGRVAHAIMRGRTATGIIGAYATAGRAFPRWRNVAKTPAETDMWMSEYVASGMKPWFHWVGGQTGMGQDRRWMETGRKYLAWHARHEEHFAGLRPMANIGVVMGQRSHHFYAPPGDGGMQEFADGLYSVLLEGRYFFEYVHEDELTSERLRNFSVLLLPNIAWLSDEQCAQLHAYVAAGGSLMASFETGLFDEKGNRRSQSGLADLFGIESMGKPVSPNGNGFYAQIERSHDVLRGFHDTKWLPGGAWRVPIKSKEPGVLSAIPAYTGYPPELSYSEQSADGPALIAREIGGSRLIYFSGDIERAAWRSGDADFTQLLRNSFAWLTRERSPVKIEGPGLVECFAWETSKGFALHVLNYTNPAAHRGWFSDFYPIGEQRVRMELPADRTVTRIELLRSEKDVAFKQSGNVVEFSIPQVVDYEVAALHA